MTISKNILLASVAVLIVALLGVAGFILLKPKIVVAPTSNVETPKLGVSTTATPYPTPSPTTIAENQIKLTVTNQDGSIVKTNKLTVKGTTVANAEVFVNDLELKADTAGNFSGNLTLEEGDNSVSILAVDENGNYSEKEITITYEP